MRKALPILTVGLLFSVSAWSQNGTCDLTNDGKVDQVDVQAAIDMSLGVKPCTATVAGANVCNVVVVQRIINASQGGTCLISAGIHSVEVTWTASTSTGVTGYKVYRATVSGGPYSLVATLGPVTKYMDNNVQSGVSYFYVISAIAGTNESPNSTQARADVPAQ